VVAHHVGHDGFAGDRGDHLGRPQGLIEPEDLRGGVVGDTLGLVVAGDFLEHDASFPLDLIGREAELSTISLTISCPSYDCQSDLRPLTTSRLLSTVDWVRLSKLSLHVQNGSFRSPDGPSFTSGFTDTDHGSTAIPHDAADIDDVEADQPLDHEQVRDGADREAGPLLGVTGIVGTGLPGFLADIGAEMAELHSSPHRDVLISLSWIDLLASASIEASAISDASFTAGRGEAVKGGVDEHAGQDQQAERQQDR
jgi:hypothetical protein